MKKRLLVLLLCLSLAGLPACARNYLYQPSIIQRGLTTDGGLAITDMHILSFADDVKLAWQKRTQVARGIGLASENAGPFLGALSGLVDILGLVFPVMTIANTVSGLFGKLVGSINPDLREGAYLDGIKLIDDGTAQYFADLPKDVDNTKIAGDKRTKPGELLLNKVNIAIYKVEAVLSGRVPTDTPAAVGTSSLKGIYSVEPATLPIK